MPLSDNKRRRIVSFSCVAKGRWELRVRQTVQPAPHAREGVGGNLGS